MSNQCRVAIDSVPVGAILFAPITDPENPKIKLLGDGIEVTDAFREKLRQRGIEEVVVSSRDLAVMETFRPQGRGRKVPPAPTYRTSKRNSDQSSHLDRLIEARESLNVEATSEPASLTLRRPSEIRYRKDLQHDWAVEHDQNVSLLRTVFDHASERSEASAKDLKHVCEQIISRIEEDIDALVCLAASPFASEYPSRHATHVAAMAMAMGVEVGLDYSRLMELGMGCLLHDIGMKDIGVEKFRSDAKLDADDLQLLSDHPVMALETATAMGESVSLASRMVAYQIHERLDASGYPRGRSADEIHVLAKIAAVADEFIALTAPRPHRVGIQGYFAIRHVVADMKRGKFDPRAVRALLMTTGLFPIGSYVVMTNDCVARVIRSGGTEFDRPMIEMWESNDLETTPVVINLAEDESIQIAGSIPMPRAA